MRRPVLVMTIALVIALGLGASLAVASFTMSRTNPQTFTAKDSFGPATAALTAQSRTNDEGASSTQIQFGLRLQNKGDASVDLGTVTMRYWFTADGSTSDPIPACYFATFGCEKVVLGMKALTNRRDGADHYVQVGFSAGSLAAGASAVLDQLAARDATGTTWRQDNDYSFLSASAFADNEHVTVYVGGKLVWGTEPEEAAPTVESVEVHYSNLDSDPHDAAIKPQLKIVNTGTVDIALSRVTVRYWFTKDSGAGSFLGFCDYAQIGCPVVTTGFGAVSPARTGADSYLKVGFSGGSIATGSSTGPIQLRAHKSDYAAFDETDDYSWATNTSLASSTEVTAYIDGKLVWGTEP